MWSCERIVAVVIALGLLVAGALSANAQGNVQAYEAALTGFTKDSFNDTDSAIGAVAASGSPLALEVINALQDGRLAFSGDKVFIKDKAGTVLDAATGKPTASAPAELKTVRLNNRLRRSVEAALGGLTLLAADPAKRLEAAQAVFRSRDANALPTLEAALAKETESRVKRALTEARAAVILFQSDAKETDKISAIGVIRERADQDARGLLAGLPTGQPQLVQRAAADAIASIDNRLALWSSVQNAWYGLSLGSVLLLAAIGLAITFGVMGVINMAHGEMVMLGA
jgi:urea transport system permease protein